MNRKLMTFVMTVALSLFVALPAAAQVPGGFEIEVPEVPAQPGGGTKDTKKDEKKDEKKDTGSGRTYTGGSGKTTQPSASGCPFGDTDNIEKPGEKRCLTWQEVKDQLFKQAKDDAKEEAQKEMVTQGAIFFFILALIVFLIVIIVGVKRGKRISKVEKRSKLNTLLAEQNHARLDLEECGYPPGRRVSVPLNVGDEEEE